ncbi:Patellin-4 [Bienertia sinuspersici]
MTVEVDSSVEETHKEEGVVSEKEAKMVNEFDEKVEENTQNESERKALSELKLKVEEAISTNTLLKSEEKKEKKEKFLRAREFKVNEAFEMLKKALIWRKEFKIESILDEDLGEDLANAAYMKGFDRENHPVCYNIFGVFGNEELYQKTFGSEEKREQFLRWRFQFMEKGIEKLDFRPSGISSILQVYDLKNCPGPSKKEIRSATYKAIGLLQDNYPELVARNVFINVPFWYYAFYSLISPFLTQRSKSKFVVARPAKVTETLLKYISMEEIPIQYGGFKRENDYKFNSEDGGVSEICLKPGSTETIEIPASDAGTALIWDLAVLGWEVSYKEEFIPTDEGSYTIIIQKYKKMESNEAPVRNSFINNEPGKVVLTIENHSKKKKRAFYRYQNQKGCSA